MNDDFQPTRIRRRLPPRRRQGDDYPPMFNLPPGVKSLILVLAMIHLGQNLMPAPLDNKLEAALGYYPYRYWLLLNGDWGGPGFEVVATPITYMFLHVNPTHLIVNVLSLAAFGSQVERTSGARFMVWLFLMCGAIGAFTQFAVNPTGHEIVVGASAGISGLFAVSFMSLARRQNMSRRRLFSMICTVIAITCITGAVGMRGMSVAWVSHVGGFLAGLLAEACISEREDANPLHDLGWFAAVIALPLFVLVVNISRYFQQ